MPYPSCCWALVALVIPPQGIGAQDVVSLVQRTLQPDPGDILSVTEFKSETSDDGKAHALKSKHHKAPVLKADDGKKADDGQVSAAAPQYKIGDNVEIISLEKGNTGQWIPCTVTAKGQRPGTYDVYLPVAPEAQRNLRSIPTNYLRKDKPDEVAKAQEHAAEMYAANLKKQFENLKASEAKTKLQKDVRTSMPKPTAPSARRDMTKLQQPGMMQLLKKFGMDRAPEPLLSAKEEMTLWLKHHSSELSADGVLEKLESKASLFSSVRPTPSKEPAERAAVLQTRASQAGNATDQRFAAEKSAQEKLALVNEPTLNGTWQYSSNSPAFSIRNNSCSFQFEGKLFHQGPTLYGGLYEQDGWYISNLTTKEGHANGTARVRRGEEPGTVLLSFKDTERQHQLGQRDWSEELLSHRVARVMDTMPGLCEFEKYGCTCKNGSLKTLDFFFAATGDDAEIFKSDGSGWYRCTILGYNQTTWSYNVFIPEGPPNERVINGVQLQWLRRIKATAEVNPQQTDSERSQEARHEQLAQQEAMEPKAQHSFACAASLAGGLAALVPLVALP